MSFAAESGYIPLSIPEIMESIRVNVNTQFGTTYDADTFVGTNFYKYFYALAQELQANEVKTSEIFLRMQEYFDITNEEITRPNTTYPGIIDFLTEAGYVASAKAPIDADAGKLYLCVDVDDADPAYATTKRAICEIIKESVVAGVVTQGTESETLALSNAQSFDFKYALPTKVATDLKLTIAISDNNQFTILTDEEIIETLIENITARYKLGLDFEPQRYFSVVDAPWAASVLLEYDKGAGFTSSVFEADFDDLLTFDAGDVTIIQS